MFREMGNLVIDNFSYLLLSSLRPTTGHCQGDSFISPILTTALEWNFNTNVDGSLKIRLGSLAHLRVYTGNFLGNSLQTKNSNKAVRNKKTT